MLLVRLLLVGILPAAFLFGVADILYLQARSNGRNPWLWAALGCLATVGAGAGGFVAAPLVVDSLRIVGPRAVRAFWISVWIPGVLAALATGGLLRLLGPVARRSRFFGGSGISLTAEDWHTREQCKDCGFLFEAGDKICQCPVCANYFHVHCWNDSSGCTVCAPAGRGANPG